MKSGSELLAVFGNKARVNTTSYGVWALLTGDVPTEQDKKKAEETVAKAEKVTKVINELRVGDITPLSVRTNDTWLSSKVKTTLLNTNEVPIRTIVVTTERGIVSLMVRVTAADGQLATQVARTIAR